MRIFKLEDYLAKYEFSAPYLLCCSDAESFNVHEIISLADKDDEKLWRDLSLGYTESKGLPILREQIVSSLYPGLTADNITCFGGAQEGIFAALNVLCEKGDHVIVITPCYQSLFEIPHACGATVTAIELREENQWKINIAEIESAVQSDTKCIIINFPHNPTGQILSMDELNHLINICEKHGVWLFSDEVYHLLCDSPQNLALPAACQYDKALSLGVMSKSFGMPGLRVGWIACQNKSLMDKILKFKYYLTICNSAPSEIITFIALKNKDYILKRNNDIRIENLSILDSFLNRYSYRFSWVRPCGGCVGFVKYKSNESIDVFCSKLVKEEGVLLMPASIYDFDSNHFRIGFGRKNMKESLEKLEKFLSKGVLY